ncbi:nuclear transport factor 2 family protein [Streptomyces hoynatensis]|uniref:Nuclear transport factor 2 family protein n=1 Tax=Streptomyces hoynatensis TaxID=1141874 RepID=A0A3A9YHT2_9ACTN|nr:nuclear transport factor 2 family protein [Streptomyces hoynatensis]RKN36695.1 nuclear transport factor 2 family protein [Streptomyces hoynatensis]
MATSLTATPPAGIAPATPVAPAASAAASVLGEPEVHRLVQAWLEARDAGLPAQQVLEHLAPLGLVVHFPQVTLRGRDEFRDWYVRTKRRFPQERHEVEQAEIRLTSPLHADVSVRLRWQLWRPQEPDGWIGVEATQHWSVVLRAGAVRLRTLDMDRAQLLPDSAPLDLIR